MWCIRFPLPGGRCEVCGILKMLEVDIVVFPFFFFFEIWKATKGIDREGFKDSS